MNLKQKIDRFIWALSEFLTIEPEAEVADGEIAKLSKLFTMIVDMKWGNTPVKFRIVRRGEIL